MCTFLTTQDKQGNTYIGRTLELATMNDYYISYYPAGMSFQSTMPDGKPSVSFTTKYGFVGVENKNPAPGIPLGPISEGANEMGLSITANMLPGSLRSTLPADIAPKSFYMIEFMRWVLGCFESVTELKAVLETGVSMWIQAEFKDLACLHFPVTDKTGKSIVIEFMNNEQQIYDNPVGVLTNGPAFPWHLDNLNNYAHLTNIDKNTGQFGSLKVSAPDSGIAMHNVPSSQISWGRFVKAAFYKQFVKQGETPDEAILLLSHIMNNFDRPMNLTRDTDGFSSEGAGESEVTIFTVMFDCTQQIWYYRPISEMNWVKVDIKALKALKDYTSINWLKFKGFDLPAAA